jgi:ribosomal protein S7
MELRLASSLTKDDLLRPGMQMIEALADELIESARERRAAQKQGQEAAE